MLRENLQRAWIKGNLNSRWNRFLKRGFDLVAGTLVLLISLPIMLLIAIMIKLDSTGPVIFRHPRVGRQGKIFNCLKFRTMVRNSPELLEQLLETDVKSQKEWKESFKLRNDPRITQVGKLLRSTSLDELPQLFNVLAGEMSLVGPRPIVEQEINLYTGHFEDYKQATPGVTGLWQVSGRNDLDYEQRVELDCWYIRNWSIWFDCKILIRTFGVVLGRKGAY